jgi:hypothetical protein
MRRKPPPRKKIMNKDIILKFPPPVLDYIAKVLQEKPFKEVHGILGAIQAQANDAALQSFRAPMSTEEVEAAYAALHPETAPTGET